MSGRAPTGRTDVTQYVERPKLNSILDISHYLGVSGEIIWNISRSPARHYRQFGLKKRSGGTRIISSPRTFLKVIQWWIKDTILTSAAISDHAHGFVRGRSPLTNANSHLGAIHVLNVDIKNFFPSISRQAVSKVFQSLGYVEQVGADLASLTTLAEQLPQGAPTSPALSNVYFYELDRQISHYAALRGLTYSRYADDLTFSSKNKIPLKAVADIGELMQPFGFGLNEQKTRFMGPGQKLEVTGLYLGSTGVKLSRAYLNKCRGWFHSAIMDPDGHAGDWERIAGTVSMIRSIGGAQAPKVLNLGIEALEAINRVTTPRL